MPCRSDSLGPIVARYFTAPVLEGLPEGTEFDFDILDYRLTASLRTEDNATWGTFDLHQAALRAVPRRTVLMGQVVEDAGLMGQVSNFLQDLRERHFLATYNVFPGWRL